MIYQGLNDLNNTSTEDNIKDAIVRVDFLNEVAGMKTNHKNTHSAKYKESIKKVAASLAKKIKARGGNPQEAFEAIALDNPGWFRQIIEFFARCLFISTEYNSMRSMKNEVQSMNEEVKMTEFRRHLVKDREFQQVADPQKINGSEHKVGKVTKAAKYTETTGNKHTQQWFKKTEEAAHDKAFNDKSPIKDSKIREVFTGEMMRFLLGDERSSKTRLTIDAKGNKAVISQKVGCDKKSTNYKNTRTL